MCVFDPTIRIAAGHPLARGRGIESMPVGMHQDRSDNDIHVSILQTMRRDRFQVERRKLSFAEKQQGGNHAQFEYRFNRLDLAAMMARFAISCSPNPAHAVSPAQIG
jgi:hypothetical protein